MKTGRNGKRRAMFGAVVCTVAFRGGASDNGVVFSAGFLDDAEKNPSHVRKDDPTFLKVRAPLHLDGIGVIEALALIVGIPRREH